MVVVVVTVVVCFGFPLRRAKRPPLRVVRRVVAIVDDGGFVVSGGWI